MDDLFFDKLCWIYPNSNELISRGVLISELKDDMQLYQAVKFRIKDNNDYLIFCAPFKDSLALECFDLELMSNKLLVKFPGFNLSEDWQCLLNLGVGGDVDCFWREIARYFDVLSLNQVSSGYVSFKVNQSYFNRSIAEDIYSILEYTTHLDSSFESSFQDWNEGILNCFF